jgi:quinol monooxygenase YgiN
MIAKGLIVRLQAKPSKAEELAQFLRGALPLVDAEPETVAWFAVSGDAHSFAIFDVFPDEEGRQAHLDGLVAAALMERADELLEKQPVIEYVDVLAAKTP